MTRPWCAVLPTGVRLSVRITPNARKNEVIGVLDDALKIKLQAPPIEGRANEALISFIAERFNLPQRAVSIVQGHLGKHKLLDVDRPGLTLEAVRAALLPPH
jgi:uncharacterized protein (TIGR00251 family)